MILSWLKGVYGLFVKSKNYRHLKNVKHSRRFWIKTSFIELRHIKSLSLLLAWRYFVAVTKFVKNTVTNTLTATRPEARQPWLHREPLSVSTGSRGSRDGALEQRALQALWSTMEQSAPRRSRITKGLYNQDNFLNK
jgi:hypothetical protein